LRKNVPTAKKVAMNKRYQHLSTANMSVVIKYKGQEVDLRKLRRQAKMEIRRSLMGVHAEETGHNNIVFSKPVVFPATQL
jgi:hypothetical protein